MSPSGSLSSCDLSNSDLSSSTQEIFSGDDKNSDGDTEILSAAPDYMNQCLNFEGGLEAFNKCHVEPQLNQRCQEYYRRSDEFNGQNYYGCNNYNQNNSQNLRRMESFHCRHCFERIYTIANMIADKNMKNLNIEKFSKNKNSMIEGNCLDSRMSKNSECAVRGPGLVRATRGKSSCFQITSFNKFSKPNVTIVDPTGIELKYKLRKVSRTEYIVQYKPDFEGIYKVEIFIGNHSVGNSPYKIDVTSHHRYQNFDQPKQILEGNGSWSFDDPWGICCDSLGNIIIGDRSQHTVKIFGPNLNYIRSIGKRGSEIGELCKPAGVSTNSSNDVIVADKDNHRVQVFTIGGDVKLAFGDNEVSHWKLKYPWDVAVGADDVIFVSDSRNGRVSCFSADGVFIQFCDLDTNLLKSPRGVSYRELDSRLFITDFNRHQVIVLRFSDNCSLASNNECSSDDLHPSLIGNKGRGLSDLNRPQGIVCDMEGNILVSDSKNSRVQVFDPEGNYLAHWVLEGGTVTPLGLAVWGDQVLVVDGEANRVLIY